MLVLVLVAGLVLLLATGTAAAHDELVGSDPRDGATVATPPARVSLTFDRPVAAEFATITVIGPDGADYRDGAAKVAGPAVSVALRAAGPAGGYTVGYRIVSSDGHPLQGSVGFTVTAGAPPSTASTPGPAAQSSTGAGSSGAPVWPWVLGGAVLVAGGAAVALRLRRQ